MASLRRALALSMMESQDPKDEEKARKKPGPKVADGSSSTTSTATAIETMGGSSNQESSKSKLKKGTVSAKPGGDSDDNDGSSDEESSSDGEFEFPPTAAVRNRRYPAHVGARVKVNVDKDKWLSGSIIKMTENKVKVQFSNGTTESLKHTDHDKLVVMEAPPTAKPTSSALSGAVASTNDEESKGKREEAVKSSEVVKPRGVGRPPNKDREAAVAAQREKQSNVDEHSAKVDKKEGGGSSKPSIATAATHSPQKRSASSVSNASGSSSSLSNTTGTLNTTSNVKRKILSSETESSTSKKVSKEEKKTTIASIDERGKDSIEKLKNMTNPSVVSTSKKPNGDKESEKDQIHPSKKRIKTSRDNSEERLNTDNDNDNDDEEDNDNHEDESKSNDGIIVKKRGGGRKKKKSALELNDALMAAISSAPPSRHRKGVERFAPSMKPDMQMLREKGLEPPTPAVAAAMAAAQATPVERGKPGRKPQSQLKNSVKKEQSGVDKANPTDQSSLLSPLPLSSGSRGVPPTPSNTDQEANRPSRSAAKVANTRIMKRDNPEAAALAEISTFGLTTQQQKSIPSLSPKTPLRSTSDPTASGGIIKHPGSNLHNNPSQPSSLSSGGNSSIPIATMKRSTHSANDVSNLSSNNSGQFKGTIQHKASVQHVGSSSNASSSHHESGSGRSGSSRDTQEKWVQCEKCEKWRKLPSFVNTALLPDSWFCDMNEWDSTHNRCAQPEETQDEVVNHKKGGRNVKMEWVQCDNCEKWRKVPLSVVSSLPDQWYCRMNKWDSKRNSCAAPEEPSEGGKSQSTSQSGGRKGKETCEWVQCDRKTCAKWRKLPLNMDPATLPDKWVCEMNFWDSLCASCAAPEEVEKDDKEEKEKVGGSRSAGSRSAARGGMLSQHDDGKMGFREILFNSDGKVRPPFSEKSLMTSIFAVGKDLHPSNATRTPDIESYFLSLSYNPPSAHSGLTKKKKYLEAIQSLKYYHATDGTLNKNVLKKSENAIMFNIEEQKIYDRIRADEEDSDDDEDETGDEDDESQFSNNGNESDARSVQSSVKSRRNHRRSSSANNNARLSQDDNHDNGSEKRGFEEGNEEESGDEFGTRRLAPRMQSLLNHAQWVFKTNKFTQMGGDSNITASFDPYAFLKQKSSDTIPGDGESGEHHSMLTMSADAFGIVTSDDTAAASAPKTLEQTTRDKEGVDDVGFSRGDVPDELKKKEHLHAKILALLRGERRQGFAQILLSLHCTLNQENVNKTSGNGMMSNISNPSNHPVGFSMVPSHLKMASRRVYLKREEQGGEEGDMASKEKLKHPLNSLEVKQAIDELVEQELVVCLPPDQDEYDTTYMLRSECSDWLIYLASGSKRATISAEEEKVSEHPKSRKPWKKMKLQAAASPSQLSTQAEPVPVDCKVSALNNSSSVVESDTISSSKSAMDFESEKGNADDMKIQVEEKDKDDMKQEETNGCKSQKEEKEGKEVEKEEEEKHEEKDEKKVSVSMEDDTAGSDHTDGTDSNPTTVTDATIPSATTSSIVATTDSSTTTAVMSTGATELNVTSVAIGSPQDTIQENKVEEIGAESSAEVKQDKKIPEETIQLLEKKAVVESTAEEAKEGNVSKEGDGIVAPES